MTWQTARPQAAQKSQRGFSLVEVLVSVIVLTVGLVALLGVFALAMASTQTAQQDMIAKQLASEAMESIITARETTAMTWAQVQNQSVDPVNGIFVDGMQSIYNAGADGIVGTTDDAASGAAVLTLPGKDGIVGTSDDISLPLTGYKRQIQIQNVTNGGNVVADLRTVTITVQYTVPRTSIKKTYILTTYISQYR